MANNLLGTGNATGMFFTATAGTALPLPGTAPGADWTHVGDVGEDGISMTLPNGEVKRNWANLPVRKINTKNGTIAPPIIETSRTVFETLFGASNVDYDAATSEHGNITSVELAPDVSAEPAAYLFLAKDGGVLTSIGTSNGLITNIADVSFAPSGVVTWTPTIEGVWKIQTDDGQTV